ncbi:SAUR-like auxin-responsive protein family [Wolffia australiana]
MKQLMRRLARVGDASLEEALLRERRTGKERKREKVPEGHLPVYVGEEREMQRFVVKADLLSRPIFVELLRRSAEEYGYEQRGVLRIPCSIAMFERVLDGQRN